MYNREGVRSFFLKEERSQSTQEKKHRRTEL